MYNPIIFIKYNNYKTLYEYFMILLYLINQKYLSKKLKLFHQHKNQFVKLMISLEHKNLMSL